MNDFYDSAYAKCTTVAIVVALMLIMDTIMLVFSFLKKRNNDKKVKENPRYHNLLHYDNRNESKF